jgi:exo-beta-1,3-glucanase (GH17 family)
MQLQPPQSSRFPTTDSRYCKALMIQAIALIIALIIVLGWWIARGVPFSLGGQAESVSSPSQMLPCVSYSPFRERHGRGDINPFNPAASVMPADIEADLRILKTRTNCIRTYGLSQGLDAVPAVVQKLGMRMKLGVWLARDEVQNRVELERGLALARQYKDVVDLLVVGNEVLLRRELSPEGLAKVLTYARQHSPVPVTYADVWEFWLRHAPLAQYVDVVTVHILPYWEDDPVAVSNAVTHVFTIAAKVQQQFAGKTIWIGETGWPAAGRQRAGAVPGKVEQSRFLSELLAHKSSLNSNVNYNVIEAFDQPWKRSFEGAMGGYWGLFDQFGQARVAFSGTVLEDAQWWRGPLGAVLGGLVGMLFWRVLRVRAAPTVLACALLGALTPLQWLMMQQWDRNPREQALSVLLAVISAVATLATLSPKLAKISATTRIALLFAASTAALVLLLDARYRPFPWWWFLAPTAALLALRASVQDSAFKLSNEARLLAFILAGCAVLIAFTEGWRNAQALSYCALLLVLAGAAGLPTRASRTKTSSANNAAGAQSSVV